MKKYHLNHHIAHDFLIVVYAIIAAVVIGMTGAVEFFLDVLDGWIPVANFFAGMFFTSVFTTPLAIVTLGEIAKDQNVFLTAAIGGAGAVIGDFVIFRFMRDHVAMDFQALLKGSKIKRWQLLLHHRSFRWLFLLLGALIIASPFPDEVGLALMGFSKPRTSVFLALSFLLNFAGILAIGLVARALF